MIVLTSVGFTLRVSYLFYRWKRILHNRWVVLTSACAVFVIGDGFFLSFGTLFVDLLEEFNESRAQTPMKKLVQFAVVYLASKYNLRRNFCLFSDRLIDLLRDAPASSFRPVTLWSKSHYETTSIGRICKN